MEPKYTKNNKEDTSRIQYEFHKPSGSVEEYLIARLRDGTIRATRKVTRRQIHQVEKTIIIGAMGKPLLKQSYQGRRPAFTQPRSRVEVVQILQEAQAVASRTRMKLTWISPLHTPPSRDHNKEEEENLESGKQREAQDPQSEEGPGVHLRMPSMRSHQRYPNLKRVPPHMYSSQMYPILRKVQSRIPLIHQYSKSIVQHPHMPQRHLLRKKI